MGNRRDSDVMTAVRCVRTAVRKCGISTKAFFARALAGNDPDSVDEEVSEFEDLDPAPDAHLPRRYAVPGPVIALARAVVAHQNPQELLHTTP